MSQFIHYDLHLHHGDLVVVTLQGCESNVFLVDSMNFDNFRHGRQFRYHGTHARSSPVRLAAPHAGNWRLVVQPINNGQVRCGYNIIADAA